MSPAAFMAKYPGGKVPRASHDYGKVFVCRRGCNTRTATYTNEFVWEDVFGGREDIDRLIGLVKSQTKATRKRRRDDKKEYDPSETVGACDSEPIIDH